MKDENKWFILTITAIEHGKYHLFAFYDHSEDVLKELDYLQQIETTKNESEYKAHFYSRMSHEIRTAYEWNYWDADISQTIKTRC